MGALPCQLAGALFADEMGGDRQSFHVLLVEVVHILQVFEGFPPRAACEGGSSRRGTIDHRFILAGLGDTGDGRPTCTEIFRTTGIWPPGRGLSARMGQYHDEPSGDHPRLEEFDRGQWVQYAQERLQYHGYEPQDHKIDGFFGPMTKEAVRDFQGHWGLETTGVIDEQTWTLLEGTPA